MKSPRLNRVQYMIEDHKFGQIKADYLPGSWVVEIRWGELKEEPDGTIKVDGVGDYDYPHTVSGEGRTFNLALKEAFEQIA